jgi:hypothetical protein
METNTQREASLNNAGVAINTQEVGGLKNERDTKKGIDDPKNKHQHNSALHATYKAHHSAHHKHPHRKGIEL